MCTVSPVGAVVYYFSQGHAEQATAAVDLSAARVPTLLPYRSPPKDVKAIVATGKGGKFSRGFDISSFGDLHSGKIEQPKVAYISIDILTELLEGATKPSVAAIDGLCLGGGLEVSMVLFFFILP
ncbi:hypothetical protein ZWY2020_033862 [Hordeum vulgare]|nr:hypothetical protein ZWY2020_033862 [Hordeum vulgare]